MIAIQSNDAKENEKYSKSMKNWNENNPGKLKNIIRY